METLKRASRRTAMLSRATRLYLLVCTAAWSIVVGYATDGAAARFIPLTALSIEQMLAWHREIAESIGPAVPGSISGVRARP